MEKKPLKLSGVMHVPTENEVVAGDHIMNREELGYSRSLSRLQSEVEAWQLHNFPAQKPHQPALGTAEEVGELGETVMQSFNQLAAFAALAQMIGRLSHATLKGEQSIRKTPEQIHQMKCDAVGDIQVYLANFCIQHGIDMELETWKCWNEVKQRDWVKFPKNGRTE